MKNIGSWGVFGVLFSFAPFLGFAVEDNSTDSEGVTEHSGH